MLRSIPKQGGAETILYQTTNCQNCDNLSLAVDDDEVFFFVFQGGNRLLAVPKTGGSPRMVTSLTGAWPLQLTYAAGNLYWYQSGEGFYRVAATGGTAGPPFYGGNAFVSRMVAVSGGLIWVHKEPGIVVRFNLGTLEPTTLANLGDAICGLATDGTKGYWAACGWPSTVFAQGTTEPFAQSIDLRGPPGGDSTELGSVAIDGDWVYFLEYGQLDRTPKAGGGPAEARAWAEGDQNVLAIHIIGFDENYAYLHGRSARIYRVPK